MKKYYKFISEDLKDKKEEPNKEEPNKEEPNKEEPNKEEPNKEEKGKKLTSEKDIKEYIQHKISQEDKKNPISDEKLSQILRASRRTIQNYRQQVGIPPIKSRIDMYKNDDKEPYEIVYGKKKEKPIEKEDSIKKDIPEYINSLINKVSEIDKIYNIG
jgi:glutaredoxin 2